ncbi:putative membrane protein [Abditibacterium utsteinense]|uniref:Putative membrane protein n=1 Tax=Abditibacterium utsteinense TaxID=1960156 RepID=A0A2S8SQV3_9BACT|nr:DUF1003 domain-containing protein [Abditibacterium utsteinense]PQV63191.1 putative membrane protein [Abditibacterium utsteinense]
MADQIHQLTEQFRATCTQLGQSEQLVLQKMKQRLHVSRDTNAQFDAELTFGQRAADKIAAFGGSWPFIFLFFGLLLFWIALNSLVLSRWGKPFDPYPYILLNLFLSMLASLQAPVIMMSQNRQSIKDRIDAAHDYEVNLKAELEILALHEKLDSLRDKQWQELVSMQREQIALLTELLHKK